MSESPPVERRKRRLPSSGEGVDTEVVAAPAHEEVRRFRLTVVEGPDSGRMVESTGDRCSVGSNDGNDLVLTDGTVSRFHCEVLIEAGGPRVRDLGSKNGTFLDGVAVRDATPRGGSLLALGHSVLRFELGTTNVRLALSDHDHFGRLVGRSVAMRAAFARLERAAGSAATVLIEGETGTGKEEAARSLHEQSDRAEAPFVVVDCAALPPQLMEAELFGHERGAFTGAAERRLGAFEAAHGGTVFLDEIGELPLELQPKLLRVLEQREVRRLGATTASKIDVRIVAATNRDMRAEVNARRFRPDLYYRLAVVRVLLPALRERMDDLPLLVSHFMSSLGADSEAATPLQTPELLASLTRGMWPGNVRELRNYLERCLVLGEIVPLGEGDPTGPGALEGSETFFAARREVLERFERDYLIALLARHPGNVSAAARAAGIGRVSLYKLMNRYGLKGH